MFVDELIVKVYAGNGGDGCTSFHREKYVPMGGPDGGNGGRGANIIFKVDKGLKTLIDLRYRKIIKGEKGTNGKGNNCNGAKAEDVIIKVPMGTSVYDKESQMLLCDLINDEEEFIVAHGGRGGRGNRSFATQSDPAPKFSERGEPGESRILKVELKVMADVGLVGMPSVGKSTILKAVSKASPKIAPYHFTTLNPNLGVITLKNHKTFVLADLPGIIEGASEGIGLGLQFLKHALRTRVIAHVIDMGSFEGRDPIKDYEVIRKEMESYSDKLAKKKEIIIANKSDLPKFQENLNAFKKKYPKLEVYPVCAATSEGLPTLMERLGEILETIPTDSLYQEEDYESYVVYKFQEEKPYTIRKEGNLWILEGKEIEKLFKMTRFEEEEGAKRFARKLKKMGVEEELKKLGAKPEDEVAILDYVFVFKE